MRRLRRAAVAALGTSAIVAGIVAFVVMLTRAVEGNVSLAGLLIGLLAGAAAAVALRLVPSPMLLAGYSALMYVILFAPIVVVVVYAFNAGRSVTVFQGVSLRWFGEALNDQTITSAVWRSARIASFSALVSVAIGTSAALVLARAKARIRAPLEGVALLALVVPELVIAISLLLFFVNGAFALGDATIMISHSLFGTAVVVLIVRSRYSTIGPVLEQASSDLGAGPWATLRQITLPQLAPAILAGALLAFTFSFDDVIGSQFTSGAGHATWPLRILSSLRFGLRPDINATATMMLGVTIVGLVAAGLLLRGSRRPTAAAK